MVKALKLHPDELTHRCDLSTLDFDSTAELEVLDLPLGQERAVNALTFGIRMKHSGYNLYLLGSEGIGKLPFVRGMLEQEISGKPAPDDICYLNNFADPQKPLALRLPTGRAKPLRRAMDQLIEELLVALPSAFHTKEYQNRAQEIVEAFKGRKEDAFEDLANRARKKSVAVLDTPTGYTLAYLEDDELLTPEEYEKLTEDEREAIEVALDSFRKELRSVVLQSLEGKREENRRLKALKDEIATETVEQAFKTLEKNYKDLPQIQAYIEAMRSDIVENVEVFVDESEGNDDSLGVKKRAEALTEYNVNVLVDNSQTSGPPIIYEDNPTYHNLVGRIDHISQMGALLTDFTLIKPGALHRANGGYLLLDVRKILTSPFAYDGLKRALASKEVRIQSLEQILSLVSTLSLEPEPIPLDVKVILLGDRLTYYLLNQYDPEFGLMFKVAADFAEELPRNAKNTALYAQLIASLQQRENLRPLSRRAVGSVIEACSRRAQDGLKVSLNVENLGDLLREADYCAGYRGEDKVECEDVRSAIAQQEFRLSQARDQVQESIERDIQLVDTSGTHVGQINGLAVLQLGEFSFGRPSRITSTVRLGTGKVIDIEREAELGGQLHSKGVMILSACLANRYAKDRPLPISATLVFEQSYGMVDGDSASTAELCALLSALANLPLRQDLAITGSINQHGEVQAIGGVNEKIEGFYDLCKSRGLSGSQGVIIPRSNLDHLMLRERVINAVRDGEFSIYTVESLDEAMALLSGLPAGELDQSGVYPNGSFNRIIQDRVEQLWALHRKYGDIGLDIKHSISN